MTKQVPLPFGIILIVAAAACGASDDATTPAPPSAPAPAPTAEDPFDDGEDLPDPVLYDRTESATSALVDTAPVDDGVGEAGDEDDIATFAGEPAIGTAESATTPLTADAAAPATQVVYVNFRGPTINNCGSYCSDAITNHSWVMGHYGKSSMKFAPYTDGPSRVAILRKLRTLFANWRVSFTTNRPATPPYTMVVISPSILPHHGTAPLDCGNTNKSDIAFVYKIGGVSADTIARFAAHELGHSFGLAHVVGPGQIMHWDSSGRAFSQSNYDTSNPSGKCFPGMIQHAAALLNANVGAR
jgi:hypothetical protein